MAMNAGTYKAPVTGRTQKKPFFTAKTPRGPGDHLEAPFVSTLLQGLLALALALIVYLSLLPACVAAASGQV